MPPAIIKSSYLYNIKNIRNIFAFVMQVTIHMSYVKCSTYSFTPGSVSSQYIWIIEWHRVLFADKYLFCLFAIDCRSILEFQIPEERYLIAHFINHYTASITEIIVIVLSSFKCGQSLFTLPTVLSSVTSTNLFFCSSATTSICQLHFIPVVQWSDTRLPALMAASDDLSPYHSSTRVGFRQTWALT